MYQSFDLENLRKENPNYISKSPFEHQKDSFEKMSALFDFGGQEHKAGILVLPTGAGKTFTSIRWICRNVLTKNIKVLWLAHTGHLLVQAYEAFAENILETHLHTERHLQCCSARGYKNSLLSHSKMSQVIKKMSQVTFENVTGDILTNDNKILRKLSWHPIFRHFSKHGLSGPPTGGLL